MKKCFFCLKSVMELHYLFVLIYFSRFFYQILLKILSNFLDRLVFNFYLSKNTYKYCYSDWITMFTHY